MNAVMDRSASASARRAFARRSHAAGGFTLIEMMVVLALVLIMMLLFASIFQITGNFVTHHKGVSENDQSARTFTTIIKSDLTNRTMRLVAPLHPNMPALPDDGLRQGYFYYSENDPLNDTDDVLQFTVGVPIDRPFMGRATLLPTSVRLPSTAYATGDYVRPDTPNGFVYRAQVGGTTGGAAPPWTAAPVIDGGVTWEPIEATTQPDGDDGVLYYINAGLNLSSMDPTATFSDNNTGASQYAEVSYFLRHGNLYRRVLLVREPYITNTGTTQPGPAVGKKIITGAYSANFWSDFDYAARFDNVGGTPLNGPLFFDVASLNNAPSSTSTYPLARPDNRFGHHQTPGNLTRNGAPREYDSNGFFFGRFTHEETSFSPPPAAPTPFNPTIAPFKDWFAFPGYLPTDASNGTRVSPMFPGTPPTYADGYRITIDATSGVANQFTGGGRRGEDILLTNVRSFDIKLLDNRYSEAAGADRNRNGVIDVGPAPAFADVGHSGATGSFRGAGSPLGTANAFPQYGPHPGFTGDTANNNNVFDTWHRKFDFDNSDGDNLHNGGSQNAAPYRLRLGNPWLPTIAYTVGTLVDPVSLKNGYVYKCITAGTSGAAEPFLLTDDVTIPVPEVGGTAVWQPQAPLAVQAIQITVKFLDPTNNLLRQVTIVQSLTP